MPQTRVLLRISGRITEVSPNALAALLVTRHNFARLLQRTYERIWRLEPLGVRGALSTIERSAESYGPIGVTFASSPCDPPSFLCSP